MSCRRCSCRRRAQIANDRQYQIAERTFDDLFWASRGYPPVAMSACKLVNWRTNFQFGDHEIRLPERRLCTRQNDLRENGALMTELHALCKEHLVTH